MLILYATTLMVDKWGKTSYDGGIMIEARGSVNRGRVDSSLSFYWYYYFKTRFPVHT